MRTTSDNFKELGAPSTEILAKTVEHFTTKEAGFLLGAPSLSTDAKVLDVGSGSGFFTVRVAKRIHAKRP